MSNNSGEAVIERGRALDAARVKLVLYWVLVGVPLGWGVWKVLTQSLVLFGFGG